MCDPMTYFVERPVPSRLAEDRSNHLSRLWKWILGEWVLAQRRRRPSTDRLSHHLLCDVGLDEYDRGPGRRHR